MNAKKKKVLKRKINTKNKCYPLNQSPFYRLSSKSKLASILKISLIDILEIKSEIDSNYSFFKIKQKGKSRDVQAPIGKLKYIHNRVASLICRIETPDYLHSGIKEKSNVTNALSHTNGEKLITSDIKSFFESTKKEKVFSLFRGVFKCQPDIADIISSICCVNNHIPTGSQLSMPVAFWSNKLMFDEFERLSEKHDLNMTVYVDDITFSGSEANKLFLGTLNKITLRYGQKLHPTKSRIYKKDEVKKVTGVMINGSDIKIPNCQHEKLYEGFSLVNALPKINLTSNFGITQKLLGRLYALGSIDPKMKYRAKTLRDKFSS